MTSYLDQLKAELDAWFFGARREEMGIMDGLVVIRNLGIGLEQVRELEGIKEWCEGLVGFCMGWSEQDEDRADFEEYYTVGKIEYYRRRVSPDYLYENTVDLVYAGG